MLHKEGRPQRMLDLLLKGEARTRREWCKFFKVEYSNFQSIINALRKHGYPVFPIKPTGHAEGEGIYRLITEKVEWSQEANLAYKKSQLMPKIKTSFMMYEKVIEAFPQLLETVEDDLMNLQVKLIEKKKQLNSGKKEYGNSGSANPKAKA